MPASPPASFLAVDVSTTTVTMVPGPLMNGMAMGIREMSLVGSATVSTPSLGYSMSRAVAMSRMPPAMRNAPTLKLNIWNNIIPVIAKKSRMLSE